MRAIPARRADLSRNGLQPLNRICSPERCLRGCATVQEIGDWLEKLGMPEYGECFAENDIDASVLPHLTDQSLKELGVSLGHRLKILAAVQELRGPTPAPPEAATPTETKP